MNTTIELQNIENHQFCAMSVYSSKPQPLNSEAEDGQLPPCLSHSANHPSFPLTTPNQNIQNSHSALPPPQHPPPPYYYPPPHWPEYPPHYPPPHHHPGYYPPERSRSPQKKKKSHKSQHKHKHRHRSRERRREDGFEGKSRREREKEGERIERKTNLRQSEERNDPRGAQQHEKHDYYPPPPYYPPYMYPPMMPPHMPPSHMYSYPPPMPYPPHGQYPYGDRQPMDGVPMSSGFPAEKEVKKPQHFQDRAEVDLGGVSGAGKERAGSGESVGERDAENVYKMFPPPDHYMYGYPPPPMGYSGYPPPPPYMMYPPQAYDPHREYARREEEEKFACRLEVINNKKQKIRKVLKPLQNQLKEEMLETVSLVAQFEEKVINEEPPFPFHAGGPQPPDQLNYAGLNAKYYQRNLMKIQKWLSSHDQKTRDVMEQLIALFELKGMREKIREAKELMRAENQDAFSESKRLLNRLMVSPRQRVF